MSEEVNETQECRIYARDEWYSLIEYVLFHKHQMPYYWAAELGDGKRALDFGCGSGYGTAILAEKCAQVTGVDASPRAIELCNENFNQANLEFVKIEPNYVLPFEDDTFDVITSFQVIEHMPDVPAYLSVLKRVLKPGGKLLITTCNRDFRLFPWQRPWQEAHFREYDPAMMKAEFEPIFDDFELKGIGADDEAHSIYREHYRPTYKDALIRFPLRRLVRTYLPGGAFSAAKGLKRSLTGAPSGAGGTSLSKETLERFSIADFHVTDDMSRAIDLFVIASK